MSSKPFSDKRWREPVPKGVFKKGDKPISKEEMKKRQIEIDAFLKFQHERFKRMKKENEKSNSDKKAH